MENIRKIVRNKIYSDIFYLNELKRLKGYNSISQPFDDYKTEVYYHLEKNYNFSYIVTAVLILKNLTLALT